MGKQSKLANPCLNLRLGDTRHIVGPPAMGPWACYWAFVRISLIVVQTTVTNSSDQTVKNTSKGLKYVGMSKVE